MPEFIFLMHNDSTTEPKLEIWNSYFAALNSKGIFEGGSSIGAGDVFRKGVAPGKRSEHVVGYLRVKAENFDEARKLLAGNPVFECGGTVEIRELLRD